MSVGKFGGRQNRPGEMYLGDVWFAEVKSKNKTIDTRPGPEGKFDSLEGKTITYFHKKDEVKVQCTKVIHYKTVKELIKNEDLMKIAPHLGDDTAIKKNLLNYYTDDKIKEAGGIFAIHFK